MSDGLQDFLDDFDERSHSQDDADGQDDTSVDEPADEQDNDGIFEQQDAGDADSDSADSESPAAESEADDTPDVKALQEQLQTLEKRFKDTQANWTREHQKALELQKQLEALKKQDSSGDGDIWSDDDDVDVSADAKQNDALQTLTEKVEQLQRQLVEREFAKAEDAVRQKYTDYDDVVEGVLIPEMQSNPALKEQWQQDGGTPEAAYALALKLKQSKEIMADPEGYKKKIEQEIMERLQGGDHGGKRRPKTLMDANSQGSKASAEPAKSPLEEALDL